MSDGRALAALLATLDRHGVRHIVCGSVGANAHGALEHQSPAGRGYRPRIEAGSTFHAPFDRGAGRIGRQVTLLLRFARGAGLQSGAPSPNGR